MLCADDDESVTVDVGEYLERVGLDTVGGTDPGCALERVRDGGSTPSSRTTRCPR
jgi:hypothetical protein